MGLFGGSKSSSTTNTTSNNAGFSEVAGPAIAVQGGGNSVSVLDGGAIDRAFSFASQSLSDSLRQVELAGGNVRETVKEAVTAVSEANRAETENLAREALKWGTLALLGWAAFQAIGRARG